LEFLVKSEQNRRVAHASQRDLWSKPAKKKCHGRYLIGLLLLSRMHALADDKVAIVDTWKSVSVVCEDTQPKERIPEHPQSIEIAAPDGIASP
jgi:hypothetical protein